jgi:hypothetical protein
VPGHASPEAPSVPPAPFWFGATVFPLGAVHPFGGVPEPETHP